MERYSLGWHLDVTEMCIFIFSKYNFPLPRRVQGGLVNESPQSIHPDCRLSRVCEWLYLWQRSRRTTSVSLIAPDSFYATFPSPTFSWRWHIRLGVGNTDFLSLKYRIVIAQSKDVASAVEERRKIVFWGTFPTCFHRPPPWLYFHKRRIVHLAANNLLWLPRLAKALDYEEDIRLLIVSELLLGDPAQSLAHLARLE